MLAERQQEMNIQSVSTALVILANSWDIAAGALAERWASHGACLLTPRDLSVAGWYYPAGDTCTARAIIAGHPHNVCDISAVVTRLPWVFERDLGHIVPSDRAYVAAEMNAFLLAWLAELPCSVLNRPTPTCLSGPYWRQEKWIQTAARLGISVRPVHRYCALGVPGPESPDSPTESIAVTIVGRWSSDSVDPVLVQQARCLADAAGVEMLVAYFNDCKPGSYFLGASLWPDIADAAVADAMLTYLRKGVTRDASLAWEDM